METDPVVEQSFLVGLNRVLEMAMNRTKACLKRSFVRIDIPTVKEPFTDQTSGRTRLR